MDTENSIQAEYNRAAQQAKEVDNIADRLEKKVAKELENVLNALGNDWKGENAKRYIEGGLALKEDMDGTVKSLRRAADTIRTVAKNIRDRKLENLRILRERAHQAAGIGIGGMDLEKTAASGTGHSGGDGRHG